MKYVIRLIAVFILAIIILLFILIKTTLFDNNIKNIIIYTIKLYYGYNVTISSLHKTIDSKTRICLSGIYININDNYHISIDKANFWFNTLDAITNIINSINCNIKHVQLYSKDNDATPLIDGTFCANLCYDKSTSKFLLFLNIDDLNHELLSKVNNCLTDIIKESSYIVSINSDGILELTSMFYTTSKDNDYQDILLKAHCNIKSVDSDSVNVQVKIDGSNLPETHAHALKDLIVKSNNYHDITDSIDIGSIAKANINFDLEAKFSDRNNININNLSGSLLLNSASIALQRGINANAICNTVHINFTDDKLHFFIPEWHLLSTTASDTIVDVDLRNSQDIELRIEGTTQGPIIDLVNSLVDEKATSKLQAFNIDLSKSVGTAKTKFQLIVPLDDKKVGQYEVMSDIDNFALPIWNNKFILSYNQVKVNYNNRQLDIYTYSNGKINNMRSKLHYRQLLNDADKPDDQALNITFSLNRDSNLGYKLPYITDGEAIVNLEYQSQLGKPSVQITSDLTNLQFVLPYKLISKDIGHAAHLQASIDINDPNKILMSMELNGNNNLNIKSIIEYSKSAIKFNFPVVQHFDNNFKVEGNYANKLYDIKIHGKTVHLESDSLLDFSKKDGLDFSILLNNTVVINLAEVVIDNKIYLNKLYFILFHPGGVRADGRLSVYIGNNIINGLITSNGVNEGYKCVINAKNAGSIVRALQISPNLQSGIFEIELDIPKDKSGMINGALHMKNFATKHTSFLTHLVAFLSLPGLYHFLILKNIIHFTKMDINFDYNQGIIRILEGDVIGRSLSFDVQGTIDLQNKTYDVKGMCTPSIYGVNDIIKMISNKYHIKSSF